MIEFAKLDSVPGNLYLPDRTLQCFKAYQTIVMQSVALISLAGLGQDSAKAMKKNILRNTVVPLAPNSKEGFDRFGDEFGFHYAQYFYDETFMGLRSLVNGEQDDDADRMAAKNIIVGSQMSQQEAISMLNKANIPTSSVERQIEIEQTIKNI